MENSAKILEVIDRLRKPLSLLHDQDKETAMKYINNLTKLAIYTNKP